MTRKIAHHPYQSSPIIPDHYPRSVGLPALRPAIRGNPLPPARLRAGLNIGSLAGPRNGPSPLVEKGGRELTPAVTGSGCRNGGGIISYGRKRN
jgi:hypothetical protein